jgi:hypothetical protein
MNEREQQWSEGYHTSSNGKQADLKDLPTPYLKNIVNKYGSDHDVSPVQTEIESRPVEEEK